MRDESARSVYAALEQMAADRAGSDLGLFIDVARHPLVRALFTPSPPSSSRIKDVARPIVKLAQRLARRTRSGPPALPRERGPLFLVDSASHLAHAAPVFRSFGTRARVAAVTGEGSWFTDVPSGQQARFDDYDGALPRARAARDWLLWLRASPQIRAEVLQAIRSASERHGAPWLATDIEGVVREQLVDRLASLVFLRRRIEAAYRALRPSAVVSFNEEGGARRLAVRVASDLGIPTVMVQHGLYGAAPKFHCPISDLWCLWGPGYSEMLAALGHRPQTLVVTGPPGFESLHPAPWAPRSPPRVLVTAISGSSQTPRDVVERVLGYVCEGLARVRDVEIRLKPHPVDRTKTAERIARRHGAPTLVTGPMTAALADADVVVAMVSTTALEAVLCEKPLVLADEDGEDSVVSFAREGAALIATSADEVADGVTRLLGDEALRASLRVAQSTYRERYAEGASGGAARRVTEQIRRIEAR